ncbi:MULTISPECIES: hypothetical protein [Paraliobacillus]|uniref:hypothetical protein n=1 Tax=Paraliobacillus TaxID=200903 RepID=UPI0013007D89|nr:MULTISPECIES: hypothetical protein [Paraliobacillus]
MQTMFLIVYSIGFSWFKKSQLTSFGLQEQQVDFLIGLVCIVVLYLILHPSLKLLMELKWKFLLTYIVTILLFINVMLFSYLYLGIRQGSMAFNFSMLHYILFDIIALGVILGITVLTNRAVFYFKQHKSNSN